MNNDIIAYEDLYKNRCRFLKKNGVALIELNNYDNFNDLFSKDIFKELMNRKQNRKNKRYRTNKKFNEMLKLRTFMLNNNDDVKIVFGTITIKEKKIVLENRTKTKNIDKWLKKHFMYSILNKDYGKTTEREHYHFLGLTLEEIKYTGHKSPKGYPFYNLVNKDYTMGHEPNLEIIDCNDKKKLTNYLLKLNNHSNKITTRSRVRIIMSDRLKLLLRLQKIIYERDNK